MQWWKYQSHNKWMQQIGTEGVQGETRLGGQGDHWEMCKKFKFDHANKWYHIYPTPPLGQDMTQGQFFKRSLTSLNSEFSFP